MKFKERKNCLLSSPRWRMAQPYEKECSRLAYW
uniref:Uncharacterized protein n=1 Tax=Siphoviridae sp. ctNEy24 TaxID=2825466 RepID=A0A8S5U0K5_9CAUD|nr:MAG TPA: hypothetical protein [Siphoviridae sp. ctNEy24]